MDYEEGIQSTNDDASECKRSAVQLGYWDDKYIQYFIKASERKAPEINRGYYARIKGVEAFIDKFLMETGSRCQIVNLGCGFDTLYWRLKDSGRTVAKFIDVDYASVTSKKCYIIKRNKTLLNKVHSEDGEVRLSPTDLHAVNYHIVGADLRKLSELQNKLKDCELQYELPTMFLAECVLVYVDIPNTNNLLSWIAQSFNYALFINYEQVNMHDRFGEVMLKNLRARGCPLAGVAACESLETQKQRFTDTGWSGSKAWDMVDIYASLPSTDRMRIEQIEFLDERELLTQLFQHYCIAIAWKGSQFADIDIT